MGPTILYGIFSIFNPNIENRLHNIVMNLNNVTVGNTNTFDLDCELHNIE
jgi:hypothetical protein